MIFKRKSFHLFRDIGSISPSELQSIAEKYNTFTPLIEGIKTTIRIVPAHKTTCKRGQEYCILCGIMPADKVAHYNRIDIGIFLCFLDLCLMENHMDFAREVFMDTAEDDCEEVLTAKYTLS